MQNPHEAKERPAICCYLHLQWLWRLTRCQNGSLGKLLGAILGCRRRPEWTIFSGTTDPYNYTHGCTAHVGELLDDSSEHRVVPGILC